MEQLVGRVLVVGESGDVPHYEREYRGLAAPSASSTDTVSCEYSAGANGITLSIEARRVGASAPDLQAHFLAPSLQPAKFDADWSPSGEENVRVRLGEGTAFQYHEYEFGSDGPVASQCNLAFTQLDANQMVGIAACRRLMATAGSADADAEDQGGGGSALGTASVTLDFSCPFHALSGPGGSGGSGGAGGTIGAGGAINGGNAGSAGSAGQSGGGMGGTGGATKHCVGVTTPCSLRSSASCEVGSGCTLDEKCDGFASSCYGQIGVFTCSAIQGCFWSSSSQKCTGSAWSCSLFTGSSSCIGQPGCDWSSDCTGTAPLCSELSEFTCELESGCHWQ